MEETAIASTAPGDELLGTTLGERYKIIKRLSQGGMGVVFLGRHAVLDNLLAVKVLLRERNETDQQRFLQEAKLASKINHPNTVHIVDFGVLAGGRSYLVMEYLKGDTLDDVVKKGRIDPLRVCRIGAQIARGLQAVHDKGIIHRDLKPANVFVLQHDDKPDFIKIVDFGIAKETVKSPGAADSGLSPTAPDHAVTSVPLDLTAATGGMVGTPAYVSPEQAQELPVDARTDQYSLGCMMFEMLTGERPYAEKTRYGLLMKHIKDPVPSAAMRAPAAKIPDSVDALIKRLMAKQPEQRFLSMRQVAEECERLTSQRRIPLWGVLAVTTALALFIGSSGYFGYLLYGGGQRDRARLRPGELAQTQQAARQVLQKDFPADHSALRLRTISALGQIRDGTQRATLEALLASGDNDIAAQAAEALGQLGEREAVTPLLRRLSHSDSAAVRLAVAHGLQQLGEPQGAAYLERALGEGDPDSRLRAAFLLCDQSHPKARPLLWQTVERGLLPEPLALHVLACLGKGTQGSAARDRLLAMLQKAGPPRQQIPIAARLAELGDATGRELLRTLSQRPGPEQLPAARALAAADEPETAKLFRKVLLPGDGRAELAARLLATEGLGVSGELYDVRLLGSQLRDADADLRLVSALAILQLAANDPSTLSTQGLSWAHGALASGDWALRESAASVLGDSQSADAVQLLTQLLGDSESRVRRSTVAALGRRVEREALLALRQSLRDADPDVRREALRSIERVALLLQQRGDTQIGKEVSGWLTGFQTAADAKESILASVILLRLGDATQRERLRSFQSASDADVRRYLIEQTDADPAFLQSALKDSSVEVRFAAARKLAERGDRSVLPVLRQAIERGGMDGIAAYGLLSQLGEKVAPPEALAAALSAQTPSSQRMAAIEAIARMPADLAVPLLLQAAHDHEGFVRRLVAEVAADLPKGAKGPPGLSVLRILCSDPDPAVRARAAVLLARLAAPAEQTAVPVPTPPAAVIKPIDASLSQAVEPQDAAVQQAVDSAVTSPPPDAASAAQAVDAGVAASGRGTLIIKAPDGVQFQLDRRAWQGATSKPISLPAGAHRLTTLSGAQDLVIESGQTLTIALSESVVEETLNSGIEAYRGKEYNKAQKYFERASSQCARDHKHSQACANLSVELSLQRGHLFEDQKLWAEAMMEYQKVVDQDPQGKGKPMAKIEAREAMTRLLPRLGQVVIKRMEDGHCKEEIVWLLPGTQTVKVDGKRQTLRVRPRDVLPLGQCE